MKKTSITFGLLLISAAAISAGWAATTFTPAVVAQAELNDITEQESNQQEAVNRQQAKLDKITRRKLNKRCELAGHKKDEGKTVTEETERICFL